MSGQWDQILLAWLHDPPDKALSIPGHVSRARNYAEIAVGKHVSRKDVEDAVSEADPLAAIVERLPMPKAGEGGKCAVGPVNGLLTVIHPLSSKDTRVPVPGIEEAEASIAQSLREILRGLPEEGAGGMRRRFLALWRCLPELLARRVHDSFARLPADTRVPDHTIWNHVDIAAGFKAASTEAEWGLLAFALGPVQPFIQAARSVRDLWSGSMILSWLAYRSMRPILDKLGPTALVYPALRGVPLMDLLLLHDRVVDADRLCPRELWRVPCIPHRFLALVPWGIDGAQAHELAHQCRMAGKEAWREIAKAVKKRLDDHLGSKWADWDKRWSSQIEGFFRFDTAVIPGAGTAQEVDGRLAELLAGKKSFAEAFPEADAVRGLARSIPRPDRPAYNQENAGRWQYLVELLARSLAAARAIRAGKAAAKPLPDEHFPEKCTLLGTLEQMGPDELRDSKKFWDSVSGPTGLSIDGVRIRRGEALCAVSLVKRFSGPAFFAEELGVKSKALRFPDTWTVAAAEWLSQAGIDPDQARVDYDDWNGQWLGWKTAHDDVDEPRCPPELFKRIEAARKTLKKPPSYYAILKLDGDEIGGWLRGEKSPKVREVIHGDLVAWYRSLGEHAARGLEVPRPVGPALHAAISTALANFALHVVPRVIRSHHGTVIYSGGDDTLALLPVRCGLRAALELRDTYGKDWHRSDGRDLLMMGSRATLSGGLVIVHAKDDLRLALADARRAEKLAKEAGRNALVISIRRRSGEHSTALCPWEFVETVQSWVQAFLEGASDRWAYHLYADHATMGALPREAIQAEIRRQIGRSEKPTPQLLPPDTMAEAFERYSESEFTTVAASKRRFQSSGEALHGFLTLCLTASFMARGREGERE